MDDGNYVCISGGSTLKEPQSIEVYPGGFCQVGGKIKEEKIIFISSWM